MNMPDHQKAAAEDQHVQPAAQAEQADERIVAADHEGRAGGGEQHRRAEVNVGQQAQRLVQPRRHLHRPDGDQFLHGPQRADRRAERAAEKEREHQRQREQIATAVTGTA